MPRQRLALITGALCLHVFVISPTVEPAFAGAAQRPGLIDSTLAYHDRITFKHRRRGVRIPLHLGPAYIYQDYPYYYSRGFYPTHIGGYVYRPYRHSYLGGYRILEIRRSRAIGKPFY